MNRLISYLRELDYFSIRAVFISQSATAMKQLILKESFWLLSILVITIVAIFSVFGRQDFMSGIIDIQLYDTYFVISPVYIVLRLYIILVFSTYLIRQTKDQFKTSLPNYILLVFTVFLIIFLTQYIYELILLSNLSPWEIYPPNATLPPPVEVPINPNAILFFIQLALTSFLIFLSIRISKN